MILNSKFQDVEWPKDIDLIVTSPPYKDEDGYTDDLIKRLADLSFSSLKKDAWMFVNFGHLAGFKSRPFRVAMMLEDAGFIWNDTITWIKNHYRPLAGKRRLNNLTEFVFVFSKGRPSMDRLSIGVPYEDKSNIKRWKGTNGKDLKCGGNVWYIPYETVQTKEEKLHNDRFPVGLPEKAIKLSGIPEGSLVVDPFMGSGTTAIAAIRLGMNYWGTEMNPCNYNIAIQRIKNEEPI